MMYTVVIWENNRAIENLKKVDSKKKAVEIAKRLQKNGYDARVFYKKVNLESGYIIIK
jgi:hypothetical protein